MLINFLIIGAVIAATIVWVAMTAKEMPDERPDEKDYPSYADDDEEER